MASDAPTASAASLSYLLRGMERRYEEAQAQLKFQVWQRVSAFAQDAVHELNDFHEAMRRRVATLRCAESVLAALNASQARAANLAIKELVGLDLSMIWPMLWAIVRDIAIYVGGGAVLGSAIGGIVGAFFGGAGAIPGAIGGAGVGAEIGAWLLGVIGIKCLVEYIGKAMPEMADYYAKGFAQAWRAGELAPERSLEVARRMESAAEAFARGHLLLVIALLAAIVLYLSRGALGRARLYGELARSKLGPKFAKWVEQNESKLVKHPALQPEKPPVAAMMEDKASKTSGQQDRAPFARAPKNTERMPTRAKVKENSEDVANIVSDPSVIDTTVPKGVPLSREQAAHFYRELGWKETRIESHLDGIDFSKPVTVEVLPRGTVVEQWVDPRRGVGNYFSDVGVSATKLGIYQGDRVAQRFVVTADTPVLKSSAGRVTDTWTAPPASFSTSGGGIQYFTKQSGNFVRLDP